MFDPELVWLVCSEGIYGPTGCLETCPRRVAKYEVCILCEPGNDILKLRGANNSEHLLVLVYMSSPVAALLDVELGAHSAVIKVVFSGSPSVKSGKSTYRS